MNSIRIRDVAPRLAFQGQSAASTGQKVELVDRLTEAGVRAVEVSSFVRPDLVPGLADAAEVFSRIRRRPGVVYDCCVANRIGFEHAVNAGADTAWFLLSIDETFSTGNTGRSVEDSLALLDSLRQAAEGTATRLGTYLIAAWGGPFGAPRRAADLDPLLNRLVDIGVDDWILADSFGYAAPPQIRELVELAATHTDPARLTVQVHDMRGMGVADVAELAQLGVVNIDTSLAGAGRHPAAPTIPAGGVATEDAVQLLELMGYDTGIDLPALLRTADWFDDVLGGGGQGFVRRVGAVPRPGRAASTDSTFRWAQ